MSNHWICFYMSLMLTRTPDFYMNDSEYVRLGQNPRDLYVEQQQSLPTPFSPDLNFSTGWDHRSSSTLLTLTFSYFPFGRVFLKFSYFFLLTSLPLTPRATECLIARARVYIFPGPGATTHVAGIRQNFHFPMGATLARSLIFLTFGCAFLTHPERCPIGTRQQGRLIGSLWEVYHSSHLHLTVVNIKMLSEVLWTTFWDTGETRFHWWTLSSWKSDINSLQPEVFPPSQSQARSKRQTKMGWPQVFFLYYFKSH